MKTRVLLDPGLIMGISGFDEWLELSEWLEDKRVGLGPASWSSVHSAFHQKQILPPSALRKPMRESIARLLSRGPLYEDVPGSRQKTSSPYAGSQLHEEHLVKDLASVGSDENVFLGTRSDLWADTITSISLVPPPPNDLQVHCKPHLPSREEVLAAAEKWFLGKRILVIGGQVENRIINALVDDVGVDRASFEWVPSERNKRATNIDAKIKHLPDDAIVVCLTGKVGHSVSNKMSAACGRASLTLHCVETASHLSGLLKALYAEDSASQDS